MAEFHLNSWWVGVNWKFSVMSAASGDGSFPYEILNTFFDANQLFPIFMDNHGTYGHYDTEAGLWRGAVGMVRVDILYYCYTTHGISWISA